MKNQLDDFKQNSSLNQIQFSEGKKQETLQKVKELDNKKPKNTFIFQKTLSFATFSVLLMIIVAIGYQSLQPQKGADPINQLEQPEKNEKHEQNNLTKQKVEKILAEFYNKIEPELDQKSEFVKSYKSKEELIENVSATTSKQVATKWVNAKYEEKDGKLKPITLHGIPKFVFKDLKLEKMNENKYTIEQLQSSEMTGSIVIETDIERKGDRWIITKYKIEYQQEQ
ncbi:hypothetical protein [Alkalihalobacillus sp. AL-G]|uniref:hypothetical protein n=1 Tax=Alkalihalobacillus sp. AL-G TaxID=2926399 RepID=UPI00272A9664|nr:hypothetical protein [Alkalihalobacillus sp. AL-G]WLD91743.1 hypothetical protein MOJ78_11890 [Alkalihalobacillus sp. AL-G]